MTRVPVPARLALALGCALALGGCISLLPKTKAVTLYRFDTAAVAEAAAPRTKAPVGVFVSEGTFQRESSSDRLLTVNGGKVAYIAQARWAAPAQVMFGQALLAAFDAAPGPARLVSRGEPVSARFILRLDVRNFETHYDHGPRAAPQVLVRVRAALVHAADHTQAQDILFESRTRARANRVSAIVDAYDEAVADVLKQLISWTDAQVAPPAAG
jgi:cholesterol transport system auxiliary component